MSVLEAAEQSIYVNQESLLGFVRETIGGSRTGRKDDEHPLKPGPWSPVIRAALESLRYGPQPDPWVVGPRISRIQAEAGGIEGAEDFADGSFGKSSVREGHFRTGFGGRINPQPLPPNRHPFLTSVVRLVAARAELFEEFALAQGREGAERSIIIVGGYLSRFADDWCGNGFKPGWPFPGPRPGWWAQELGGFDLLVMATELEQAARGAFGATLREPLANAATQFVAAGFTRLQQNVR